MDNTFKRGFWGLIFLLGTSVGCYAADGQVISVAGDAYVERSGTRIMLKPGDPVFTRDTVNTGKDSIVRFRMSDESFFALPSNSSLRISDYLLPGKSTAKKTAPRAVFSLLKGGFRTVTGLIGKLGGETYQVRTPVATIGVRGTEFSVYFCPPEGCTGDLSQKVGGAFDRSHSWQVASLDDSALELAAGPGRGALSVEVISGNVATHSSADSGGPVVVTVIKAGQTMTLNSGSGSAPSVSGTRAAIFAATLINDLVFNLENPIDRPSTLESALRRITSPLDQWDPLLPLLPDLPTPPRLEGGAPADPPASPS